MTRPVVLLARSIGYINAADIFPGTVFLPDFFDALAQKYRFQKFPSKREDFDIEKGIEFVDGFTGKVEIEKFVIWKNILVLETRVSTDASKESLETMLEWATEKFDLKYQAGDIKRFAYINSVAFNSSADLLFIDPVLRWLSERTSALLSDIWQEPVEYRPTSLKVGHDPVLRHLGIAPFSVERRGSARFSDNQYFSEAPLPTKVHMDLLEQFEARVLYGKDI